MIRLKRLLTERLREHLATGKPCALPAGGELFWRWFTDLSGSRTWHANGPNPISYVDIVAYMQLYRWPVSNRHIAVLRALDHEFLEHMHDRQHPHPASTRTSPPVSRRSVTVGLFDAMFG